MKLNVSNNQLSVGSIKVLSISSSSLFLVGDTQVVTCSSVSDIPLDSLVSDTEQQQGEPLVPGSSINSI